MSIILLSSDKVKSVSFWNPRLQKCVLMILSYHHRAKKVKVKWSFTKLYLFLDILMHDLNLFLLFWLPKIHLVIWWCFPNKSFDCLQIICFEKRFCCPYLVFRWVKLPKYWFPLYRKVLIIGTRWTLHWFTILMFGVWCANIIMSQTFSWFWLLCSSNRYVLLNLPLRSLLRFSLGWPVNIIVVFVVSNKIYATNKLKELLYTRVKYWNYIDSFNF